MMKMFGQGWRRPLLWALFLGFFFAFRFFFGLYCPPLTVTGDEIQIYLIGLKSYATHTWPYFGPDVRDFTDSSFTTQIPGALLGLLIALPLRLWPAPESPYLFLNLLSFGTLTFLGFYCAKRLPGFPAWFILACLYVAPWELHFSTQVINLSYADVGAILFFIGFFEATPALSINWVASSLANALMGFGFFWAMQLHMSWVLLAPFLVYSWYAQLGKSWGAKAFAWIFLGAVPMMALLVPTYVVYGFRTTRDVSGFASGLNWGNFLACLDILAKFLSFACFEMPRFVGEHTRERLDFFWKAPWLLIPGFFLWVAGWFQALGLLFSWFRPSDREGWKQARFTVLGAFLIVYASFLFTPMSPTAHKFYIVSPVAMIYSFYAWDRLRGKRAWRIFGLLFLAMGIYFQVGYMVVSAKNHVSAYAQKRMDMERAIRASNYRLLGERFSGDRIVY